MGEFVSFSFACASSSNHVVKVSPDVQIKNLVLKTGGEQLLGSASEMEIQVPRVAEVSVTVHHPARPACRCCDLKVACHGSLPLQAHSGSSQWCVVTATLSIPTLPPFFWEHLTREHDNSWASVLCVSFLSKCSSYVHVFHGA